MSKVWNVLKTIPKAVGGYESELPRPEGTRDFPGKGLLTALVDVSGSEIQRRRAIQDKARWTVAKPLLDNYWQAAMHANPEEMELYSEKLTEALGYDKGLKKWLQEDLFPKGQQIAMASKVVGGIPQPVQTGAPQPPAQSGESTGESIGGPYGATPVPESPESSTPWLSPPVSQAPQQQSQRPVFGPGFLQGPPAPTSAPAPTPQPELRQPPTGLYSTITGMVGAPTAQPASNPMQSLLRKISPPAPTETEKSALRVAEDYLKESFKAGTELDKTKALERFRKELAAQYPEMDVQVQEDVDVNGERMMVFYDRKTGDHLKYVPQAPKESSLQVPLIAEATGTLDGKPFRAMRHIDRINGTMRYFNPATNEDITGRFQPNEPGSYLPLMNAQGIITGAWNPKASTSVSAPVEGARKTGLPAGVNTDLTDFENAARKINDLAVAYKPEFVGPIEGRYERSKASGILSFLPFLTTPEGYGDFAALSADLKNSIIKLITGAQMGLQESQRILQQVPVETDKEEVWMAKYKQTQKNADFLLQRTRERYGLSGGTGQAATGAAPDVSQDALVNFIMSRNRGLTREQAIEALNNTSPETIAGLRREAAGAGGAGATGGGADTTTRKVGDIKTFPNGRKAQWDGSKWNEVKQ